MASKPSTYEISTSLESSIHIRTIPSVKLPPFFLNPKTLIRSSRPVTAGYGSMNYARYRLASSERYCGGRYFTRERVFRNDFSPEDG
ncbi:MAG TPA: hypothetical protein VKA09_01625 [Nitrososphaeraceae archaeon]|nr:hypothetical protein [Nitrososphaeraceae archaeon]